MSNKFIDSAKLPSTLWCKESSELSLPKELVDIWKGLLDENDLTRLAMTEADQGFVGGVSKEETDKHFAWRYNGSCARVLLSLLDPKDELQEVSDAYAKIFSGNKVFLADLPSGSGAALISILSTLIELRRKSLIPRYPLELVIVAGEISPSAIEYLEKQLENIKPFLEEQAITIEYFTRSWDVMDKISTSDLIREMTIKSLGCTSRLLILSNFNGFLGSSNNWKKAKDQFDEIFRHSRDVNSAVIWIEPQSKKAQSLVDKLVNWFQSVFKGDSSPKEEYSDEQYAKSQSLCKQPLKTGNFPVRLTVLRFDLPLD
ncbi:hypothetical protein ACWO0M_004715 [Vibrio parahaemolyticus]|nr:hypothetical protein [Vibrio vulnificus]MBM4876484.1 hypothetical protein [Vibrio parahaemolyticus]